MADALPGAGDELPHRPGPGSLWAESWYFDYAARDGSLGGYVRLAVYPNLGVAWFWTALVGAGRSLVAVRDHEVPVPRRPSMEVRAEGLWSALNCETPYDHWSIGLEAFAVELEDPSEAYRGERGERTALGLDLEWEASAPVFPRHSAPSGGRYEQACSVYGDVLVGNERLDFLGWGRREHWWGIQDWWGLGSGWTMSGRLSDGSTFAGWDEGGYLVGPTSQVSLVSLVSPVWPSSVRLETVADPAGLPVSATLDLGDLTLAVTPIGHAPVLVEGPGGRTSRLARALCRYQSPGPSGVTGMGWGEWLGLSAG